MRYLRQSTAAVVEVGPFVDDGDGKTLEEALTVGSIDVQLMQPLDTSAVPPDRVANGAFASDVSWTKNSWTIAGGVANSAGAQSTTLSQTPATAWVQNVAYEVVYDVATQSAGSVLVSIGGTDGTARSTVATFTETIIAGSGALTEFKASSFTGTIDNVVIKQVPIPITPAASGSTNDMVLTQSNTGTYWLEITANQVGIVGRHKLTAFISGALIVWEEFMVLEEEVFDDLFIGGSVGYLKPTTAGRDLDVATTGEAGLDLGNVVGTLGNANVGWVDASDRVDVGQWLGTAATSGTGGPDVNVNAISDDTAAAATLELFVEVLDQADGQIDAGTFNAGAIDAGAIAADAATEIANAVWDTDATGRQTGGTFGQAIGDPAANAETMYEAIVTDAAGANVAADIIAVKSETATIVADTNELQTDDVPGLIAALNDPTAATVANAVWDTDATGRQTAGTFGRAIGDPAANTETMYDAVVTDANGTNVATDAALILADTGTDGVVVNAAGLATDAVNEIVDQVWNEAQADHVAAGSMGLTASEIASILDDTDLIDDGTSGLAKIAQDAAAILADTGTDGVVLTSTGLAASAANEIRDAVWAQTMTEATAVPSVTGSLKVAIEWLLALARNRMTQTSTTTTLRNDANDTDIATSTVSDDSTTGVRGEWS